MAAIFSGQALALVSVAVALACIANAIFNVFFHPLRKFPGPLAHRASCLSRSAAFVRGELHRTTKALHDRYGPVVRIAPNELSFVGPQAWRDIYAPPGGAENPAVMPRYEPFYRFHGPDAPDNLGTVDLAGHAIMRRQVAPAFSERTLQMQEPIIREYVDLLVRRLGENSHNGDRPLDLVHWLSCYSFDIIAKLIFGHDFSCLESSKYHPWVKAVMTNTKEWGYVQLLNYMGLSRLVHKLAGSSYLRGRIMHEHLTRLKLEARLAEEEERPDLVDAFLKLKEPLDLDRLLQNVVLFINAGSETSATFLVSFFALLGDRPEVMRRVTAEVRTRFRNDDEITLASTNELTYVMACIHEALRYFHPVPIGFARVTPPGGGVIAGYAVPPDTVVSVPHWATYRNAELFADAQAFHPERFLKDERFAGDCFEALQPFSLGHQNCVGRNLALAETRLALAKILFHFDVEVLPESRGWTDRQKAYLVWDRKPFYALLKPVGNRV